MSLRSFYILLVIKCVISVAISAQNATTHVEATRDLSESHTFSTAVIGGSASLLCKFSLPAGDAVKLIFWYKSSNATGQPWYAVDARNGSLAEATHFPSEGAARRVSFNVSLMPPSLRIHSVLDSDHGDYLCRVDFRQSRTALVSLFLQVIVPPKSLLIVDEFSQILTNSVGPFDEDSLISLTCESEGGKPLPNLIWSLEGNPLNVNLTMTIGDSVARSQLNLSLTRELFNKTLTCKAQNLYFSLTKSIRLDMNLRPTDIRIISEHEPLISGSQAEFVCRTQGSRPAAEIMWFLEDIKLTNVSQTFVSSDKFATGFTSTSVLKFAAEPVDDGSRLRCRAQNKALVSTPFLDTSFKLRVYYEPRVQLRLEANSSDSVMEGSSLSMKCHVVANPADVSIHWSFNGRDIDSLHPLSGLVINGDTLYIDKLHKEMAGSYQCSALSARSELFPRRSESQVLYLSVLYAPTCKAGQKMLYGLDFGESANISCEVDAMPPEVTFRWQREPLADNDAEPLLSFVDGTRSWFEVKPLNLDEFGTFRCTSENAIGSQIEPCYFTLMPLRAPLVLTNCALSPTSGAHLTIKCEPGQDRGLPQTFHLEVHAIDKGSQLRRLIANQTQSTEPFFDVGDLPGNESDFALVVYASNAKGRSPPSFLRYQNPSAQTGPSITRISSVIALFAMITFLLPLALLLRLRGSPCRSSSAKSKTESRSAPDVLPLNRSPADDSAQTSLQEMTPNVYLITIEHEQDLADN